MINRDESELIAREQRKQRESDQSARAPHAVSTPRQFEAVPADLPQAPESEAGQQAKVFRTLVRNRATRHAPGH